MRIQKVLMCGLLGGFIFITGSAAHAAERNRVAVLNFQAKNAPVAYSDIVRDLIEVQLQKSNVFDIIERDQIGTIIRERNFQQKENGDTGYARELGKVVSADLVVMGSVSKISGYIVTIKVVDVKSGTVIVADSQQAPTDAELELVAFNIAGKIKNECSNWQALNIDEINSDKNLRGDIYFGMGFRYNIIPKLLLQMNRVPKGE